MTYFETPSALPEAITDDTIATPNQHAAHHRDNHRYTNALTYEIDEARAGYPSLNARLATIAGGGLIGIPNNGFVDISDELQDALNSGVGHVVLGPGDYLVSSATIEMPSRTVLEGVARGAVRLVIDDTLTTGIKAKWTPGQNPPAHRWGLKNLTIVGNDTTLHGLDMTGTAYGLIDNVEFTGFTNADAWPVVLSTRYDQSASAWRSTTNNHFRAVSILNSANGLRATKHQASVVTKALTGNVATLTTSGDHGFLIGDVVTVAGVDATFNGTFTITAVTDTTLSYAKTNTDVSSAAVSPAGTVGDPASHGGGNFLSWHGGNVSGYTGRGVSIEWGEGGLYLGVRCTTSHDDTVGWWVGDAVNTLVACAGDCSVPEPNDCIGFVLDSLATGTMLLNPLGNGPTTPIFNLSGNSIIMRGGNQGTTPPRPFTAFPSDVVRAFDADDLAGNVHRYTVGGATTINAHDVVYPSGDRTVQRTSSSGGPYGGPMVATETATPANTIGCAAPGSLVLVDCDSGQVDVGDTLVPSTTNNAQAKADNAVTNPRLIIGTAQTGKSSGSAGTVTVLVK